MTRAVGLAALVCMTTLAARNANAQTAPPARGIYADLGLHVVGVGYEQRFSPGLTAQIDADYYAPWTVTSNPFHQGTGGPDHARDIWGLGVRARVFVFPWGEAPSGPFVSPFAQAFWVRAAYGGASGDGFAWAVGVSVGYSLVLAHAVALRLGVGIQYHLADVAVQGEEQGFSSLWQHVDIQAGYVF